eukprot:8466317-Ditylum_brightwellii.AAC.1
MIAVIEKEQDKATTTKLVTTSGATSQTSPCQQKETILKAKLQEFCCFTPATKRLDKKWTAKFAVAMEKLHALKEASLSQNLSLLS